MKIKSLNESDRFYFGKEEAAKYKNLICKKLGGKTISKRMDKGEKPGGVKYEADKLGIDMWDFLRALEGMCYNGDAVEIDDSTYKVTCGNSNESIYAKRNQKRLRESSRDFKWTDDLYAVVKHNGDFAGIPCVSFEEAKELSNQHDNSKIFKLSLAEGYMTEKKKTIDDFHARRMKSDEKNDFVEDVFDKIWSMMLDENAKYEDSKKQDRKLFLGNWEKQPLGDTSNFNEKKSNRYWWDGISKKVIVDSYDNMKKNKTKKEAIEAGAIYPIHLMDGEMKQIRDKITKLTGKDFYKVEFKSSKNKYDTIIWKDLTNADYA